MPVGQNRLLSLLPPKDLQRISDHLTTVSFAQREGVYRAGGPVDFVYFPQSGILSQVVVMLDGATVEVGVVGFEGMLGATTCLGATVSSEQVFCQAAAPNCLRMPTTAFIAEVARTGALRDVVHDYLNAVLFATARYAACNARHTIDARCARWVLMSRDRAGTDEFPITQEFLATMLGVRRATVTEAAGRLQSAGLIAQQRGRVRVINRAGLEQVACECYPVVRAAFGFET